MSDQEVVRLHDVSFAYNGETVLENVNLTIEHKDFAWIVGPNGGGKTTLLNIMLGLLKPSMGTVRVFGRTPQEARPRIGYMPQQVSLDMSFPANVLDIVLMGRLGGSPRAGFFRTADKDAAREALAMVGLSGFDRRALSEISGGQQRRLFIARALSCRPDLLLLDEPTANLDLQVQRELYILLEKLNSHLTIVMVSHDPAFVSEFVKQVVCVKKTVDVHPTGDTCGDILGELYGEGEMRIVRHDRHFERGGDHD